MTKKSPDLHGRAFTRMSCRRGRLEVGRRLPLNHSNFCDRLLAHGSREMLKESLRTEPAVVFTYMGGSFLANLIPKSTGFRVGL